MQWRTCRPVRRVAPCGRVIHLPLGVLGRRDRRGQFSWVSGRLPVGAHYNPTQQRITFNSNITLAESLYKHSKSNCINNAFLTYFSFMKLQYFLNQWQRRKNTVSQQPTTALCPVQLLPCRLESVLHWYHMPDPLPHTSGSHLWNRNLCMDSWKLQKNDHRIRSRRQGLRRRLS